jgi:uncharacterized protein YeaO (DUF488 family)
LWRCLLGVFTKKGTFPERSIFPSPNLPRLKEVAPSAQLRKAFGHDPKKWNEFKRLYAAELEHSQEHWQPILHAQQGGNVTLIYGARDTVHNNAAVSKEFLEKQKTR